MSYQENDRSGYEDNSIHQSGWQGEPEYRRSTPMRAPRRGRLSGCLVTLLVVLALIGTGYGVVRSIRNFTEARLAAAAKPEQTQQTQTTASPEQMAQPPAAQQPQAEQPVAQPEMQPEAESAVQPDAPTQLPLQAGRQGAENYGSDAEGALSLQQIYAKLIPSVVSISSTVSNGTSTGTGIIMSADGYIITNHHVISGAQSISVLTSSDEIYGAVLVGSDEASDLAVLKVEADTLTAAEFGDSDALRVGDLVVAIGDPLGVQLRGTMTDGIISAINRDLTVNDRKMTLIQTNAALNNGNSGGPLINCYGQVIGINTIKMSAYYSSGASVEGLGFAIPISTAKPIIDVLIENGYVAGRPAIGINGESLPTAFRAYYRLPNGIYLTYVNPESDACAKGLQEGDIITAINDVEVSSVDELNTVKNDFSAGDTVTLTVYRGGKYYLVDVVLMDQALQ